MSGAVQAPLERLPPSLNGLQYYSSPPGLATGTVTPVAGDLYGIWIPVPVAGVVSTIWCNITAAGVTSSGANENWLGLANAAGLLLASSGDQAANFAATGNINGGAGVSLGGSFAIQPPGVWGLVVANFTTMPTFRSAGITPSDILGPVQLSLTIPLPYQRISAGALVLPASFNPVANVAGRNAILLGLS